MSAIPLRDSFIDVHLGEEEIEQHVLDVIKARPTGPERRAAIAYLRQIVASDARDIDHYRYINARARQVLEAREKLHHFDIRSEKHTDLFVTAVGVNYTALLAVANAEVRRADPQPEPERHRRERQLPRHRDRVRRRGYPRLRLHRQR